ncbi:EpsG family protein [Pedobacter punctiformis]|uniref:EpsG family protein n=1 Tax=Pedobacter punctiformis TaxID=3004097 RepID=A0ABT4L4R4_9SPHI|nr:EpsG family protein [Pedobacter sp. HCMS5-2]MCZ4242918.1 EpsG family protein [Pedobacter sp. HCMS5-2]
MTLLIILLFGTLICLILAGFSYNFLAKDPINKALIYWGSALVLILIAGLREVGSDPDSVAYKYYYESPLILLLAEPTFALISSFARQIFNDFQVVLIVYAIIGISLKYYAIEKLTQLKFLAIITYFGSYYLLHDFTQIRAGVASAIFLIAIVPLSERKFFKFFLLTVAAFFFHYSALVLLPLWFLTNDHLSSKWKISLYLLIPIGIIMHFMKIDIMLAIPIDTIKYKIQAYQEAQEIASNSLNVFNLLYVVKYVLFYVFLYFYETLYIKVKYMTILLKIYGVSLAFYLMFSQNTILAMRVSELLGIVEILLIPSLFYVIKERGISSFIVVMISAIYLYINIYYIILVQVFK